MLGALGPMGAALGTQGILATILGSTPKNYDEMNAARGIHKKSFLVFIFPGDGSPRAILPMYENIQIQESKSANIVTYDPVGRSSSLYSYAGASSRALKLTFYLTLPHIVAMHEGSLARWLPGHAPESEQKEMIAKQMEAEGEAEMSYEEDPYYEEDFLASEIEAGIKQGVEEGRGKLLTGYVKYVSWWVNLIRSSVLNNQKNLMEGPPVIRLTHGPLYQNIPCICKSYNVSYEEVAGMDRDTLLSRRIKVDMDLEEFRAGNFGDYKYRADEELIRDNVAGWEAIIEHSTYDPGR